MNNPRSSKIFKSIILRNNLNVSERNIQRSRRALILTVVPVQIPKVCERIGNEVKISDGV